MLPLMLAALMLIIGGCGGTIQFAKDGATQADLDRDREACQAGPPGIHLNNPMPTRTEWMQCLQDKGWRIVPNQAPQTRT
jgi:hypothetical protein